MSSSSNSIDGFENIGLTIEKLDKFNDQADQEPSLPEANSIYKYEIGTTEEIKLRFQKLNMKQSLYGVSLKHKYKNEKLVYQKIFPEVLQTCLDETSEYSYMFDYKKFSRLHQSGFSSIDQNFTSLQFISNFDSSNLAAVYLMENNQYDIILHHDFNSYGYTAWFNFKIATTSQDDRLKLNIINLVNIMKLLLQVQKRLLFFKRNDGCIPFQKFRRAKRNWLVETWLGGQLPIEQKFKENRKLNFFAHIFFRKENTTFTITHCHSLLNSTRQLTLFNWQ